MLDKWNIISLIKSKGFYLCEYLRLSKAFSLHSITWSRYSFLGFSVRFTNSSIQNTILISSLFPISFMISPFFKVSFMILFKEICLPRAWRLIYCVYFLWYYLTTDLYFLTLGLICSFKYFYKSWRPKVYDLFIFEFYLSGQIVFNTLFTLFTTSFPIVLISSRSPECICFSFSWILNKSLNVLISVTRILLLPSI